MEGCAGVMRHPITLIRPAVPGGRPRCVYPWAILQIGDDFLVPLWLFPRKSLAGLKQHLAILRRRHPAIAITLKATIAGVIARRTG